MDSNILHKLGILTILISSIFNLARSDCKPIESSHLSDSIYTQSSISSSSSQSASVSASHSSNASPSPAPVSASHSSNASPSPSSETSSMSATQGVSASLASKPSGMPATLDGVGPKSSVMSISLDGVGSPSTDPEVKKICGATDHPPLCLSIIAPFMSKSSSKDIKSILDSAISASIETTKSAMTMIEALSLSDAVAPYVRDCKESYEDAVSNLHTAAEAVKAGDIGKVNSMLSAAVTDFSTCDDGFSEAKAHNPMVDLDDKLMNMASICLALASLVK